MQIVYRYLTSPLFRQRIEAIAEKVSDMQVDLAKERKTMTRLWAKRESQITEMIESTFGMYGDLQGIVGTVLQEIDGLDMQLLDSRSEIEAMENAMAVHPLERHPLSPTAGNGGLA
jgi:hypothetical protein